MFVQGYKNLQTRHDHIFLSLSYTVILYNPFLQQLEYLYIYIDIDSIQRSYRHEKDIAIIPMRRTTLDGKQSLARTVKQPDRAECVAVLRKLQCY